MELLILFLAFAIFYAYFGYPLLLLGFLGLRKIVNSHGHSPKQDIPPPRCQLCIVISAYNEAQVISEKIENTLSLNFQGTTVREHLLQNASPVEVIVVNDGSSDLTGEIVEHYRLQGVLHLRLYRRQGKETGLKQALHQTQADYLLLTDSKVFLDRDALDNACHYMVDNLIGAVSSCDYPMATRGTGSGEVSYLSYEMTLRSLESQVHGLVGLSGSGFLLRRSVMAALSFEGPSDLETALVAARQGLKCVHVPEFRLRYGTVNEASAEFERKARTVLGGMQVVFRNRDLLNPWSYGLFAWMLLSHKVMRWLVPPLGILLVLLSLVMLYGSAAWMVLPSLIAIFGSMVVISLTSKRLQSLRVVKVLYFFLLANLAILVAWGRLFCGKRVAIWAPSAKEFTAAVSVHGRS